MKLYFPKEYSENPNFIENYLRNSDFIALQTQNELDTCISLCTNSKNEIDLLKTKFKSENIIFCEFKLIESYLTQEKNLNEENNLEKYFQFIKFSTILHDKSLDKVLGDGIKINLQLIENYEEMFQLEIKRLNLDKIKLDFKNFISNYFEKLIKSCSFFSSSIHFSLKDEKNLLTDISDDYLINNTKSTKIFLKNIITMKKRHKINKQLLYFRNNENNFLRKQINETYQIILDLIPKQIDSLFSNKILNSNEDISFKTDFFEYIKMEFALLQKSSQKNNNKKLNENYKTVQEQAIRKIKKIENSNNGDLQNYAEQIKALEKEIKLKRIALEYFKNT